MKDLEKRPIKGGKRPITEGKRPIKANGLFPGTPPTVENGLSKKAQKEVHDRRSKSNTKIIFSEWETDFLPLLVLMRRSTAPVKTSIGYHFLENIKDFPKIITQYWC